MQNTTGLLEQVKQHNKLAIRVSSNSNNNLPEAVLKKLLQPHRKSVYFFVFIDSGSLTHKVDLTDVTITGGQLLFVLPNQIHTASAKNSGIKYFKLIIDQNCLSLLPKQFFFLINPLNSQIISFDSDSRQRVKMLFKILNNILHSENDQKNADIILAHLNSLLVESDNAYFKSVPKKKTLNPANFPNSLISKLLLKKI